MGNSNTGNQNDRDKPPSWRRIIADFVQAYSNAQHTKNDQEPSSDRAANWAAGATVAIAAFTFAAIGVGIAQWSILSRTLDEMKGSFAVQRAYVYMDDFKHPNGSQMADGYKVEASFRNFGQTPAVIESVAGKCSYFREPPKPIVTDDHGALQFRLPVAAGAPVGVWPYTISITSDQINMARNNFGSIRCLYNVWYFDVRMTEHVAEECLIYNFNVNGFLFCPEVEYRRDYQN